MSSYPVGLIIFLLLISLAHFLTPVLLIGGKSALSLKQKELLISTAQQLVQPGKRSGIWRNT